MKYSTTQKKVITEILKENEQVLTVNEILGKINEQGKQVGQTTIYRCLTELEQEEIIKKVENGNKLGYLYIGECYYKHIHMLCKECGKIVHLEEIDIKIEKKITIDLFKSNLVGLCKSCEGGL